MACPFTNDLNNKKGKSRVKDISDIVSGSHIVIVKCSGLLTHSGIVEMVIGEYIIVIEFTKKINHISIYRSTYKFSQMEKELGKLYIVDHGPRAGEPDDIIERARS